MVIELPQCDFYGKVVVT